MLGFGITLQVDRTAVVMSHVPQGGGHKHEVFSSSSMSKELQEYDCPTHAPRGAYHR
jgi:hypothetical protein